MPMSANAARRFLCPADTERKANYILSRYVECNSSHYAYRTVGLDVFYRRICHNDVTK